MKDDIEKDFDVSGFDPKNVAPNVRLVNKDGTLNVNFTHIAWWEKLNIFRFLIRISNIKFAMFIIGAFLLINSIFATAYYLIGLEGLSIGGAKISWTDAFFFSSHTMTTVGYGNIVPVSFWINFVASLESLMGLLSFSIATGLVYGRFTNSRADIIFSEQIIISPYEDNQALMLRLANYTGAHLSDLKAEIFTSWIESDSSSKLIRKYAVLPLETDHIGFLTTSWTLVHNLTDDSPLLPLLKQDTIGLEIIVAVEAFDELYDQRIKVKTSYLQADVVKDAVFTKMTSYQDMAALVDVTKISDITKL